MSRQRMSDGWILRRVAVAWAAGAGLIALWVFLRHAGQPVGPHDVSLSFGVVAAHLVFLPTYRALMKQHRKT